MKFYETHYEEYTTSLVKENLHPKMGKIFSKFPKNINNFKNLIFYGPSGVGKYTQVLKALKMYSPTELKYEKKISVTFNKQQYFFKISDIHYEIDMSLLGCNSKLLWHDIYQQIVDIVAAKTHKYGIIVCKYFNDIHSELLENFYSYMQQNAASSIELKYILITEELSFIPDNILNCCETIHIGRPTKSVYNKCLTNNVSSINLENITNIKNLHSSNNELMQHYKIICDKILHNIINIDDLVFLTFRDILYDILIYNLDVSDCIWYILSALLKEERIKQKDLSKILVKTYTFFQYYNNNYRPIYHLENYLFYLTTIVHGLDKNI